MLTLYSDPLATIVRIDWGDVDYTTLLKAYLLTLLAVPTMIDRSLFF